MLAFFDTSDEEIDLFSSFRFPLIVKMQKESMSSKEKIFF